MMDGYSSSSIHPQGWVPVETNIRPVAFGFFDFCSIHPQGWVPVETRVGTLVGVYPPAVAFTPKGGCPLKQIAVNRCICKCINASSIHPQGWVPVETKSR